MTTTHRSTIRTRRAGVAALAALLLGAGVGCSAAGGSDVGTTSGDAAPMPAREEGLSNGGTKSGAGGAVADDAEGGAGSLVPARAYLGRDVIATAQVTVRTADVGKARDRVRDVLTRYVGYVAEERTERDRDGETVRSVLRLRVPTPRFDAALGDLEELAPAVDVDRSTEDVTQQVVDVASRIRTQEISLDRLRGFLDRATDVEGIVRLEAEIARREGDLGSLRAQQRELRDLTSESTITLHLEKVHGARKKEDPEEAGFLTGLAKGWGALTATLLGLSQALGVVLPFAFVLALVGVPLGVWLRRRRAVRAVPAE